MEYDRDMLPYGQAGTTNEGDRYTYLAARISSSGAILPAGIVELTSANSTDQLFGDNNVQVDCMTCHSNKLQTAAAWYKSIGCGTTEMGIGPTDNPNCDALIDPRFAWVNGSYDSFNRNAAISYGWMKQSASAGLGATIDLKTGVLSGTPATIPAASIAAVPNSANCAICHARNEGDSIGLPKEAQQYGGMIAGYGNYFRITKGGEAFDFDEINSDGSGCATGKDCKNDKQWNEFGCKTGMGKRSQKTGYGSADRFGFGICYGCAMFTSMQGATTPSWWNGGLCGMPSVQALCNEKAGANLQTNPMAIVDANGYPKQIANKMPDYDVHDIGYVRDSSGNVSIDPTKALKCGSCHYAYSGTTESKTISATVNGIPYSYTYAAKTIEKVDHEIAQGFSMLEKANDYLDGTVTCASCHITKTHPNSANAPVPTHNGFDALHFEKIDCRTCHIPNVFSSPGRLLFRDWSAGAYRQADGSNGNANHFDFLFNFAEGAHAPMPTVKAWVTTPEGTKITPILPSTLPVWTGAAVSGTNVLLGWSPAKTRDVTVSAALVSAANPGFGIRLNETNDHPPFEGFQLTDPLKIESAAKINAMANELSSARTTLYGNHGAVNNARLNLFPTLFDPSHGIAPKEWALGGSKSGGCEACHSSGAVNPMTGQPIRPDLYNSKSVGFFDSEKELLKNGMMLMADYDCGGDDSNYTTGGWSHAAHPDWMCGMFESGTNPATCDAAEVMACRGFVAGKLFPMFGLPSDIGAVMPIDGISMMQQVFAIKSGTFGNLGMGGCDPRLGFFGAPTGCNGTEFFTRDETRLHYKKNIQQVKFTTTGLPGAAQTVGRVFGVMKVGKNPTNSGHVNQFDLGATCYDPNDPTHSTKFACADAPSATNPNYIKTFVEANELLGYTEATRTYLMGLFKPGVTCPKGTAAIKVTKNGMIVTLDGSISTNATSYTWNFGDGATQAKSTNPITTHTYTAYGTYVVKLTIDAVCGPQDEGVVTLTFAPPAPVASFTFATSGLTACFDATASTNAGSYTWNFGGAGTADLTNPVKPCFTYAAAGTSQVSLTITDVNNFYTPVSRATQVTVGTAATYPTAYMKYTYTGNGTYEVNFDASASVNAVQYTWSFGDGATLPASGQSVVKHTYPIDAGKSYTACVTVTSSTSNTAKRCSNVYPK